MPKDYSIQRQSVNKTHFMLENPKLFSTNKVGIQVNNYLLSPRALMLHPIMLAQNPSLRPDPREGAKIFNLDFSDCRNSQYRLKTSDPVPVINKSTETPNTIDRKFIFAGFTRIARAIRSSIRGTFTNNFVNNNNLRKRFKVKEVSSNGTFPSVKKRVTNTISRREPQFIGTGAEKDNSFRVLGDLEGLKQRLAAMSDQELVGHFSSVRYLSMYPFDIDTSNGQKRNNDDAQFFTDLLQRSFLQFTEDGKPSEPSADLDVLNKTPNAFFELSHTHGVQTQLNNTLHQSFMVFDYSKGSQKLEADDTIVSATLRLKVKAHFGERNIPSHEYASQLTSLFGELQCEPRQFEVVRVKKEISNTDISSDKTSKRKELGRKPHAPTTTNFDSSDNFKKWETPYGTGPKDVDVSLVSDFTISKPLKVGEFIDIDITEILRDAIKNRSQVLRIVVRPKSDWNDEGKVIIGHDGYMSEGGYGQGNHWFEFFDEPGDRPQVIVKATLSPTSSRSRINSFKKTRPGSSITK